jgi:type I restriction enzyme R subunit
MFLDKPVMDRNAVQTLSRLNRCHEGKSDVVVVDFTNNAKAILKAFAKYRKGTPFEPAEPDQELPLKLYREILSAGVFTAADAHAVVKLLAQGNDPAVQNAVQGLRVRFQASLTESDERKNFVYLLARLVRTVHFLTSFFTYATEIEEFAAFAEYVGPQLIKEGNVSELMRLVRQTEVVRAAVTYRGTMRATGKIKVVTKEGRRGTAPPPKRISVADMISEIRLKYAISDEEALYIKEVTEEKTKDQAIQETVQAHRDDRLYLEGPYQVQVNGQIQAAYAARGRYDELADEKYIDTGAIFDIMAVTVIQEHLYANA